MSIRFKIRIVELKYIREISSRIWDASNVRNLRIGGNAPQRRLSYVDSVDIGQAPGRRPILEKRDIESIKAILAEFYDPIFLLEETIYRLFPPFSLGALRACIFFINYLNTWHNIPS